MNQIKQTSQAILFEEFNSAKENLRTMLDTQKNVNESGFIANVRDTLGVSSFKEFLAKFSPEMWEYFADGKFYYTTDADVARKYNGVPKSITDNTYYQMLVNMYDQKGSSGQANSEFDDTELLNMLSPQAEVKEAKRLRLNFEYVTKEYYKAREAGENTAEHQAKIFECRDRIIDKYKDSKVALLPLAINDTTLKINALNKSKEAIKALPSGSVCELTSGQFSFDAEGNVCTLVEPPKDDRQENRSHNVADSMKMMIEADFEENYESASPEDESGTFIKNMMVSIYAPGGTIQSANDQPLTLEEIEHDIVVLKNKKNEYEKYYTDAKEAFFQELSKVIEKVIGVKIFFDHATAKNGDDAKLELPTGLIVANCKPADLVDAGLKAKFEAYIDNIGKSQGDDKCWFAILPSVKYLNSTSTAQKSANDTDDMLKAHKRTNKEADADTVRTGDALTITAAKSLLKILNQGHILTVFNFDTFKGNTFADITDETIGEVEQKLQDYRIDYPHAVYAYPNFTLMRERRVAITDEDDAQKIKVPGIHIDAAYPAAGLLVGSQQMSTLKSRGLGNYLITDEDNMNPVRINLEDALLQENFTTKFNRENVMNWSRSVVQKIQSDMFGFAFCGNETFGKAANTYILTARTMNQMENKQYKPIYRVMMEDFIFQLVELLQRKRSQIEKELLNNLVLAWRKTAKKYEGEEKINLVLLQGEDVAWQDDKRDKLKISFKGGDEALDNIDIVSDDAGSNN